MSFFDEVYKIVKQVPKGKVISYGQIAKLLGNKNMSRQVGWALHKNPSQQTIPCHRVVNRDGRVSKAFVFGGENVQRSLLENEGVVFDANDCVLSCHFVEL